MSRRHSGSVDSAGILGQIFLGSCLLGLLVDGVLAQPPDPAAAQLDGSSEAAALAGEYVDAVLQVSQLKFRAQINDQICESLGNSRTLEKGIFQQISTIEPNLQADLNALLFQNNQSAVTGLGHAVEEANRRKAKLTAEWRTARSELNQNRLRLYDIQATSRLAGKLASLLSIDNRWLWLCGLIAALTLVGLVAHERRHEIRRRLNGGRARSMGLARLLTGLVGAMVVITVGIFVGGDRIYVFFLEASSGKASSVRDEIQSQIRQATAQLAKLQADEKASDVRFDDTIAALRKAVQRLGQGNVKLAEQCEEAVRRGRDLQLALQVEKELAEEFGHDIEELEDLRQNLAQSKEQIARYHVLKQQICGGLGLGLFGLVTTGGWLFRRGIRKRQAKIHNTCPLCLGEGTFAAPTEQQGSPGSLSADMVQCKNQVSDQPYEECDFVFPATYQGVAKLCFPTLGIPQAGKTHWLAMVYRELNRGNFPEVVQFERIKSKSSELIDQTIDELLHQKIGPAATQTDRIPHPIVFNFIDHDHWGVSEALINIFDYSGEVIRSQTLEDRQRQRALNADGFLFFLDPTEPSETQAEALAGFREDLRRIKGVRAGEQIRTPVALCIPKIDLMINERYADPSGEGVIGNFYRDLGNVGWDLNLTSIEARSQIMARLRDTVWPGWQIERQIDDLFGGRHLFFPLSPVGLNGLGERDLSRRTIAPVGLIDPLLWLLHMNGYPVLEQ